MIFWANDLTMPALTPITSSRVGPGLRGIPDVITTTSELDVFSESLVPPTMFVSNPKNWSVYFKSFALPTDTPSLTTGSTTSTATSIQAWTFAHVATTLPAPTTVTLDLNSISGLKLIIISRSKPRDRVTMIFRIHEKFPEDFSSSLHTLVDCRPTFTVTLWIRANNWLLSLFCWLWLLTDFLFMLIIGQQRIREWANSTLWHNCKWKTNIPLSPPYMRKFRNRLTMIRCAKAGEWEAEYSSAAKKIRRVQTRIHLKSCGWKRNWNRRAVLPTLLSEWFPDQLTRPRWREP